MTARISSVEEQGCSLDPEEGKLTILTRKSIGRNSLGIPRQKLNDIRLNLEIIRLENTKRIPGKDGNTTALRKEGNHKPDCRVT